MVKLVDTRDLKSLGVILRAGSSPAPGTMTVISDYRVGFITNAMSESWHSYLSVFQQQHKKVLCLFNP